jgi:hypothetical protein
VILFLGTLTTGQWANHTASVTADRLREGGPHAAPAG